MNKKQLLCMWIGIIVVVLMALFPPVEREIPNYRGPRIPRIGEGPISYRHVVNYEFLLTKGNGTVVIGDLFVQWVIASGITAAFIYALKDKKPKDT